MSNNDPHGPSRKAFGAQPMQQTQEAAGAIRRLAGLLLALEHPHETVADMLTQLARWERELAAAGPADLTPRIGPDSGESRRIYLDHAFDIGAYNPCFPEYRFDRIDTETACGTVNFLIPFEGPPGLVHGGFLAVFFDCVIQHQNCATGPAGKTRSLEMTYRRPTPLLTELRFDIERTVGERTIESTARLLLDDVVLCAAVVSAVAAAPSSLAGARFGQRGHEPA
ncbi:hypothetical protein [Nocardia jiangxiensis]|uniref:hypothetical protein n=1 Tax=Nocardia jiangxiensis TaxID=282685 RepID=UPI00030BB62A|nr:hypothetical protein [Nocardia jiangxiensis]